MPASRVDARDLGPAATTGRGAGGMLVVASTLALLSLWCHLPLELASLHWRTVARISLEGALLLGALALLARRRGGAPALLVILGAALAATLVALLRLAELLMRETLARPLNPLIDVELAPSVVHLLTETLGPLLGGLALTGLALVPVLMFGMAFIALRATRRALDDRSIRIATLAGCALVIGLFGLTKVLPASIGHRIPVSAAASTIVAEQWRLGRDVLREAETFARAAADDPWMAQPPDRLLAGLGGADVLLMFIESYGRSAIEQPRYGTTIVPTLEAIDRQLARRGLAAASAYLTSPTVGGQSWLAHGTLESGLWLADQNRYDLMLQSERLTLTKAFARAGYRTIALKPAITRPWPESAHLGFARIYAAADLGYAGKPYNWVTMPDQYTLSFLERVERGKGVPLFVEASLISSHAPWTPIPPVLDDWSAIGDGRVFSRWAEAGDPPEVVWRDPERVRIQYGRAVDYVLRVLGSYATNFVDAGTLLILVGDHQPSPRITGQGAGRDVPIHVISGDPALLEPFLGWGLARGMVPPPVGPARSMAAFRDFFLAGFGASADAATVSR